MYKGMQNINDDSYGTYVSIYMIYANTNIHL